MTSNFERYTLRRRNKEPTREEVSNATEEFLSKGGKIEIMKPDENEIEAPFKSNKFLPARRWPTLT